MQTNPQFGKGNESPIGEIPQISLPGNSINLKSGTVRKSPIGGIPQIPHWGNSANPPFGKFRKSPIGAILQIPLWGHATNPPLWKFKNPPLGRFHKSPTGEIPQIPGSLGGSGGHGLVCLHTRHFSIWIPWPSAVGLWLFGSLSCDLQSSSCRPRSFWIAACGSHFIPKLEIW